jgi:hypothetical protein
MMTNTGGALKFGTGGYKPANERLRIGKTGGISIGNAYVGTDPGPGALIVSGNVGIGTTAPAANLEVNGTATFDGLITFDAGQTFPGTGTITGITTSSPLTGSGTSGTVTLGLNTTALETTLNGVYARLGASNEFQNAATFDSGLIGKTGQGSGYSAVDGEGSNGSTGVLGNSDTGTGVYGTSTSGSGGSFLTTGGTKPALVATNSSTAGTMVGLAASGFTGIMATGTSEGIRATGTLAGIAATATGGGGFAVSGSGTNGAIGGLFATDDGTGPAVDVVNSGTGTVMHPAGGVIAFAGGPGGTGVFGTSNGGNGGYGVWGVGDGGVDSVSHQASAGVYGSSSGIEGIGVAGIESGTGGYGVYAHVSGAGDSVHKVPIGVYAVSDEGSGVEGFSMGQSQTYASRSGAVGGVWGDTAVSTSLGGIVGSADNNRGGYFINNSATYATVAALNKSTGGSGLPTAFRATTLGGSCGIGDGNLSCSGQMKMLATTGSGERTVETYAMHSPEDWMEDFGTGATQGGVGVVQIEAAFADTVSADASYHVFLTPNGDSKGLYVTAKTARGFEVREAGGGTASISFDYRIVAKSRGHEGQRLVDVTERVKAEKAEDMRSMPNAEPSAPSTGVVLAGPAVSTANIERAQAMIAAMNARAATVAPQAPAVVRRPSLQAKPAGKAKPVPPGK